MLFEIRKRYEIGYMSEIFLGKWGSRLFYLNLVIYLWGDLAIYAVTVPLSLATATGPFSIGNWHIEKPYYLFLALFFIFTFPWTFFNFQKTKPLQIATLAIRNIALFMYVWFCILRCYFSRMIILGLIFIGQGHGAPISDLPLGKIGYETDTFIFLCYPPKRNSWSLWSRYLCFYVSSQVHFN